MDILRALIALSPILICAILIALFKKSAVFGASVGITLALVFTSYHNLAFFSIINLIEVSQSSIILTLSAVIVIIPGLYLNNILREQGILSGIVEWINNLRISSDVKALFLLLGVLPALESLTGFGVSLFLGVPVFLRLFESRKAYKLSMLGMNAMPWGTLALATILGASISGYNAVQLAESTAKISALVFPVIGCIGLFVIGGRPLVIRHGIIATIIGLSLSGFLYLFAWLNVVEISGVVAGIIVASLIYLLLGKYKSSNSKQATSSMPQLHVFKLFYPYLMVLALVCFTRVVSPLTRFLNTHLVIRSEHLSLAILSSPGVILTLTSIVMLLLNPKIQLKHRVIWKRGQVSGLNLFLFILLSQLMNQSGLIDIIVQVVAQVNNHFLLFLIAPLAGMLSGFITGSTVGGNALMMHIQQQIGASYDHGLLFSALQNSSAGHAALSSLSIIVLVLTIGKDFASDDGKLINESDLLRFGLKSLLLIYIALVISFMLQYYCF